MAQGSGMALLLLLLAVSGPVSTEAALANPIRKVVTMLQDMQKKVTEEGEKEQALFDKFMCYCKTSGGSLSQSIEDAEGKIEAVSAALKSGAEKTAQTKADLKEHKASRAAAEDAVSEATALREKEASEYAKVKADSDTNIAGVQKAVAALEKGMGGAFLQTPAADLVKSYAMERASFPDSTRQELLAFLSGTEDSGYSPQSGEITGILKQMGDEMSTDLADATTEEQSAIANYEQLTTAKKKEIATLQAQIEKEMERIGNSGVELTSQQNDLEDTKEALAADKKFQDELEQGCKTKAAEWEEIKKTRAEELLALAETVKVLNDDDALDLFKKTLPSAGASLLQLKVSTVSQKARALQMVRVAAKRSKSPALDLIALALNGKAVGFDKIIKMIDDMVANLKKEQEGDDSKKEYCDAQFDESEDKKKELELSISDSEKAISEMKGSIEKLGEELSALEAGIKALDKSVAEATEQRKADNADYKALMSSNKMAKEVLGWAKNRLNKFYNPKLYKPPPKRELSAEDRIVENHGGEVPTEAPGGIAGTGIGAAASLLQIREHSQLRRREAPPPPPETFGAYTKKGGQSNGVIAMIDLLVKDLDTEMQEAEVMEKDAQADYEKMLADASEKRATDSKSMGEKESAKADTEEDLQSEKEKKAATTQDAMAVAKYIGSLHSECDWLLQYFEARKTARADESDALVKGKAVLSGADYALLQTTVASHPARFLASRAQ
jgi:chromosome segregation ATPase